MNNNYISDRNCVNINSLVCTGMPHNLLQLFPRVLCSVISLLSVIISYGEYPYFAFHASFSCLYDE